MAWITAEEALQLLKVRPQTLYANVSRGRIRARPDAQDPRRSRYHGDDVHKLAQRQHGRRKAAAVAAEAIEWGDPVLPSALSTVIDGRLFYCGQDAVVLAETAQLEDVAGLLWSTSPLPLAAWPAVVGLAASEPASGGSASGRPASDRSAPGGPASPDTITRALGVLAARAVSDLPTLHRAPAALLADAADVHFAITRALLGAVPARSLCVMPMARRIAQAWRKPQAEDAIRRTLVLLADHELNASTFAARVTASTGASLSASVLAGLATLIGPLHGGYAAAVRRFVDAARQQGAQATVRERLAQGRTLPGFGHPLYPQGDARARALLAQASARLAPLRRTEPPSCALHTELARSVEALAGERPNIDFALSAVTQAWALPAHAPLTLFAIARSVGWLAHAMEQAREGRLIRPRARYVGPAPTHS